MALTEHDIDRIGDKVEIKLLKAMERHRVEEHEPIKQKVEAIDRRNAVISATAGGIAAGAVLGLKKAASMLFGGHS